MFDYDLIIIEDEYQIAVTLKVVNEISIIEAGFIAAEMYSAVEWWKNYES